MRVAINAQLLSFSDNYRNGGISRYIRSLLTELARQAAEQSEQPGQVGNHDYTIFVNGREVVERLQRELPASPSVTYVAAAWPESRPVSRVTWEQFTLPGLLRKRRIDVFHSPANVLPELLPRGCKGVVTLHDLAFLRYPHVLTRAKRIYHRAFTTRSLRRATLIIANSDSTKRDAIELVGIAPERIQTVYPCIDTRFSHVITNEEIASFRQQSGLEGGYILYLGTLEPRKNIPALLEAYARLRSEYQRTEKLALVGGKGWLYDEIFARAQALGLASDVLFTGFVSDADQLLWYRAASAFVYPSLYEGFGLPVSEALACGIPVVTSSVSSLPEAGAGLALTVNPGDIEGLVGAMLQAL
ncbi:MAG TPA: glycosyltransferase family 1 protein, partial [Ktedonobacteraceae bacterium]|nr:glycosyltransferase family 1 protein [Ktedonobacteraceae bacterium]